MSNPGAIVVRQRTESNEADVWFYSHHEGNKALSIVRASLAQGRRWSHPAYLARIIFEGLIEGRAGGDHDFGIGVMATSSDHPIVVVDVPARRVFTTSPEEPDDTGRLPSHPAELESWTFNDCVKTHDNLN